MKFVCSNCKAKYQIADEKIQGRTLKMDCRRCNTSITIRGDLPQQADEMEFDEAEARPASVRPPAGAQARKPTSAGSSGGSSVGAHPSRSRPGASQAGHAPMGQASMGHASVGHSAPSALGADFRRGSSIAPEARPVESRTSVLDQWHVAINDVPVGPMRREEVSRKIATGAVTQDSLAWREGFDDWRPVRDIPELAALLRKAEPIPSRGMPAPRPGANTSASSRLAAASPSRLGGARGAAPLSTQAHPNAAAARGNVVPIGGRLGGAAPQLEDEEGLDEGQDEPTQIASAADLGLLAFGDANALKGDAKPAAKAPEKAKPVEKVEAKAPIPAPRKDPTGPTRAAPPAGGFPAPKAKEAPKSPEPVKPAPIAAQTASPLLDDDGLPPLVAPAPLVTPAPAAPAAPAAMSVSAAQTFAPAPVVAREEAAPRRKGLPVGAWMGIAGAIAFGAVFAFVAAQRMLPPTTAAPAAVATVTPPVAPTEPEPPPVELDLPVETPVETAPVVGETAPPVAPEAVAGTHHAGSDHPATRPPATGGSPTGPTTSAADEAARRALLERLGGSDTSGGPATIGGPATRRDLRETETAGTGELTAEQISHVVTRERAGLTRCWETAIRGMRETPTVRMDVDLTIGSSGTVSSTTARGPTVGTLSDCIERSVRRWRFPASGGTSRTSFPVVFSGTN